jgi:uncharacterized protein (DUF1015 family)
MTETQPPAALHPFRGWRFTGALADAIGPPADIESSEDARAFVEPRPRNAVRLEIADDGADLRFTAARALLSAWERDGTLRRDAAPSLYIYEQEFDDIGVRRRRRGIFGLAPIDVPEVCVLPHEDTWEDNLARRTRLLGDLRASLSPIFLLYNGDPGVSVLLDELTSCPPDTAGADTFGETHRLWRVSDGKNLARLSAAMQGRHYVIADGHHRFAAARLHHDEQPSHATGVILACCVEANDHGIVIRPIHRLLDADASAWQQALAHLAAWFDIDVRPVDRANGWALIAALGAGAQPTLGLLAPGGEQYVILRLRAWENVAALLPSDVVEPVRQLDVTVATALVIERAFGLAHEQQPEAVGYTNDPDDVLTQVAASHSRVGLLLRPPLLAQVMAVAQASGRMPPKSTSFVPKLPIGIVMHDFEPATDAD